MGSNGREAMSLVWLMDMDTMGKFVKLLRDIAGEQKRKRVDDEVWLNVVNSGYVLGVWTQAEGSGQERRINKGERELCEEGATGFGKVEVWTWSVTGQEQLCSGICRGVEEKWLWIRKVLLLFRMSSKGESDGEEYALLKYMKCTDPLYNIDERLWCNFLRWSTEDKKDYTRGQRGWGKLGLPGVGEWFGMDLRSVLLKDMCALYRVVITWTFTGVALTSARIFY